MDWTLDIDKSELVVNQHLEFLVDICAGRSQLIVITSNDPSKSKSFIDRFKKLIPLNGKFVLFHNGFLQFNLKCAEDSLAANPKMSPAPQQGIILIVMVPLHEAINHNKHAVISMDHLLSHAEQKPLDRCCPKLKIGLKVKRRFGKQI